MVQARKEGRENARQARMEREKAAKEKAEKAAVTPTPPLVKRDAGPAKKTAAPAPIGREAPVPPLLKGGGTGRKPGDGGIPEKTPKSRRGVRQGDLSATQPRRPAQPSVDFVRPNPLDGDVIMDATARLLAPRTTRLYADPPRREEPKPQPSGSSRRRHGKHSAASETVGPDVHIGPRKPAPAASRKAGPAQEPPRPKRATGAPAPAPKGRNKPGNDRRKSGPPRRDDAAEAKGSMMKPYYWNEK